MQEPVIKVLLVEDDDDNALITRQLLSRIKGTAYLLESAKSYDAGLEAILKGEHDICLLDYSLGERDGLEFLHQAAENDCKTPMIVLTETRNREVDLRAAKAGAADYMIKGHMTISQLERSIRYAIENGRIRDPRVSALESMRFKSEFVANLSHEVRTSVTKLQMHPFLN